MKRLPFALIAACSLAMLAATVCHPAYYPPPPPPPPMQQPPLVQLAERNGFETGRSDGARDASYGAAFHARNTRAYHDTPGYDPQLGPFPVHEGQPGLAVIGLQHPKPVPSQVERHQIRDVVIVLHHHQRVLGRHGVQPATGPAPRAAMVREV